MTADVEQVLLRAMHDDHDDVAAWHALYDWLLEQGDPRVDFARLQMALRGSSIATPRSAICRRAQGLLALGCRPCMPVLTNSIGMELALIPAGNFLMGSPQEEEGHSDEEEPQHEVEISRPFYLGVYPVTQGQWQAVMGNNPSWFSATGGGKPKVKRMDTSEFPVEQVSWEDATVFLKRLSELENEVQSGRKYRLPTEAEWEYACRGGASSYRVFHFGNSLSSSQANFNGDYPYGGADKGPDLQRTCKVGSYRPNAFGLFDMHGNVWEWCEDWYGDYDADSQRHDPAGPPEGSSRVFRGGSWYGIGEYCRAGNRNCDDPSGRDYGAGFRVARVPSGR